jgi:hypothetical protein
MMRATLALVTIAVLVSTAAATLPSTTEQPKSTLPPISRDVISRDAACETLCANSAVLGAGCPFGLIENLKTQCCYADAADEEIDINMCNACCYDQVTSYEEATGFTKEGKYGVTLTMQCPTRRNAQHFGILSRIFREDDDEYIFAVSEGLRNFEKNLTRGLVAHGYQRCGIEAASVNVPDLVKAVYSEDIDDDTPSSFSFSFDGSARGFFIEAPNKETVKALSACYQNHFIKALRCRVVEVTEHYLEGVVTGDETACADYTYNTLMKFEVKNGHKNFELFTNNQVQLAYQGNNSSFLENGKRDEWFAKGMAAALVEKCNVDPCAINFASSTTGLGHNAVCAADNTFFLTVSDFDTAEKLLTCINSHGRFVESNHFTIKSAAAFDGWDNLPGLDAASEWCVVESEAFLNQFKQ